MILRTSERDIAITRVSESVYCLGSSSVEIAVRAWAPEIHLNFSLASNVPGERCALTHLSSGMNGIEMSVVPNKLANGLCF